ncbi:MAG: NAD(P)/FAD-dependent oxidoreductase [Deltaproteobacteria bacterium]|nr:NAD(P)/FAD-dependent oxidoreductase [Deltaproteobacteria bacterium]
MAQRSQDKKDLRIVTIGAGMAGVLSAIKLREAGYNNFIIYEKGDTIGGTWRENTYPGLACDVPAHLYTYSFEPNPDWSRVYAPGPEIRVYFENVAKKYGVVDSVRFNEEITSCEFIDGRWHLRMKSGKTDHADVVIAASGVLHYPNIPEIPGLGSFKGACFHSARWDHRVPLDGKRVGVIGTGSTAIQITSALVDRVARFKLFQRTAQWVLKLPNREYDKTERAEFAKDPKKIAVLREELDQFFGIFSAAVIDAESPQMKQIERDCLANLDETVKDPALRERLRPHYRAACKRLIMSPDFYEAIQHPHAELVAAAIEMIEPQGIRTKDGVLHELDVLVLATGFRADRFIRPAVVRGRGGIDLDKVWEDHPVAYLSISVPNFPNFFMLNGPNGPVGNFSLIRIAELQLHYILQLLEKVRTGECREISPTHKAATEFEKARAEAAKKSIWATGCKSWYLDKHGVPASWPWSTKRFDEEMAKPKFEAYEAVG